MTQPNTPDLPLTDTAPEHQTLDQPPGPALRPGELVPGQMLSDGLQIKAELGSGGMGRVYLARDFHLARQVAVKLIKLEGPAHKRQEHLQRFLTEARATAQLNHPNIVSVYSVGNSDGLPYLVMEEVQGRSLDALIHQGPLAPARALALAAQIAEALIHAHDKGIVHRDLKPLNVIVQPDDHLKILDFGLATLDVSRQSLQSVMQMGADQLEGLMGQAPLQGGTMAYMAPEQWRGLPQDGRTDLWALGVTLFEMVTGQLPFANGLDAVLTEKIPSVHEHDPSLPQVLDQLIAGALQRAPEARYPDARAMKQAIEATARRLERAPDIDTAPLPPVTHGRGADTRPEPREADALARTQDLTEPLTAPSKPKKDNKNQTLNTRTVAIAALLMLGVGIFIVPTMWSTPDSPTSTINAPTPRATPSEAPAQTQESAVPPPAPRHASDATREAANVVGRAHLGAALTAMERAADAEPSRRPGDRANPPRQQRPPAQTAPVAQPPSGDTRQRLEDKLKEMKR